MTRLAILLGLLATAAATSGCVDHQSVLSPGGPQAAQIARLSWLLFAFGAVVLLIVLVALWIALRGPDRARATLASPGAVIWGGIAFPAVTLTALLGYGVWLTQANTALPPGADPVRIEVIGEQWWWRLGYVGADGQPVAAANEIRIPVGQPVSFILRSPDVIHSFWVPGLGGKVDMIPGRETRLNVQAARPGIFRGACAEYCGGPHALMAFEVVALQPAEYSAWLQQQARPAQQPATPNTQRGRDLFLAAGCGACHAVRGTPAAGTVGPDLTHLASRRSVGIDTLPLNAASIARFITNGQHIKPGNLMPEFRIFSEQDLSAVADYLAELR